MKRTIGLVLLGVVAVFAMVSCGGGGGGGGAGSSPPVSGFTSSDFAGKSIYHSDGDSYSLAVFASDGTFQTSNSYTSGSPVLNAQNYSWSVTNGEFMIHDPASNDSARYVLLNNDVVNRYYTVHQYNSDGSDYDAVLFYDQITGLQQVQAYVGIATTNVLPGQYTMTGLTITSGGITVTEGDLTSWSGSIDIGHTTMAVHLNLEGSIIDAGGSYTATWTSATGGTLFDGYDTIYFTLSGGSLTLIWNNWLLDGGGTADMMLYFQKVSDSHVSASVLRKSVEVKSVEANGVNIFRSISQLMKSLKK